jgi:hypothetical protein
MKLNLTEVAIALLLENNNPSLIATDFLKDANVVPADWQLVAPPAIDPTFSQIAFNSGVSIVAQPNRLAFAQNINSHPAVWTGELARRYIHTLPLANYQGVINSFQGYIEFPNSDRGAKDFINDRFLAGQAWQDFLPDDTSVRLGYQISDGRLVLNIQTGSIARSQSLNNERDELTVVIFSGDFMRAIDPQISADRRAETIVTLVNKWEEDARGFTSIIEDKLIAELGKNRSPMVAPYIVPSFNNIPFALGGGTM